MDEGYEVSCELDVGKSERHAVALNAAGERAFDKPLPQDEVRPRELSTGLCQHRRVLVIVGQPNTNGALSVAVVRDCGCTLAYLPGLTIRKAAGEAQAAPGLHRLGSVLMVSEEHIPRVLSDVAVPPPGALKGGRS